MRQKRCYIYSLIHVLPSQRLLNNLYQESGVSNILYYMCKYNENQYMNNIVLLCDITICKKRKIFRENITKKEETSPSKLNINENAHFVSIFKKLKVKQQT